MKGLELNHQKVNINIIQLFKIMKKILEARIINSYQSKTPKGFYDPVKGHQGFDLAYTNEPLPSPVSGEVVAMPAQLEMGNCLYIRDSKGTTHVFAHLSEYKVNVGDKVVKDQIIAKTGNTGRVSTGAHLHYEVITSKPLNPEDKIMTRSLSRFSGYNTNPLIYLKSMENQPILDWAKEAVTFASNEGLITATNLSEDKQWFLVVLKRYHDKFNK